MNAFILSVGDELVLGQTVDTNSAWISAQLSSMGCEIIAHKTVGDDQLMIEAAVREAAASVDLLIISGGIGPTEDDLTRQALGSVLNSPLELNDTWMARLDEFFKARGRTMPETNKIQAMIPRGATMLDNPAGTAAGIQATLLASSNPLFPSLSELEGRPIGRILNKLGIITREQVIEALDKQKQQGGRIGEILLRDGLCTEVDIELAAIAQKGDQNFFAKTSSRSCVVFSVPGVPKEMKAMFEAHIRPYIKPLAGGAVILQKKLNTFGLGESWVAEQLGDLMQRGRNPSVGTTVAGGMVSLRLNARFESLERAEHEMQQAETACRSKLGDIIFSADETTLAEVVAGLLKEKQVQVATAESCTGGLLAKMLTDVPGSSAYFKTGFITYSNQAKYERLGVSMEVINLYGAVSEPVVDAMARAALRLTKSHVAISISGIAGPDGGSPAKPVGTVCIGLAYQTPERSVQAVTRTFNFPGDREMIRDRSAKMALSMLRYHLLETKMPF